MLEEFQEICGTSRHVTPDISQCDRLTGYFCSDTVFNLSIRVLLDSEVVGFDFGPTQKKINEFELRRYFQEICKRMGIKWNFRN